MFLLAIFLDFLAKPDLSGEAIFMTSGLGRVAQLVLFTRPHCSLCEKAKLAISICRKQTKFDYAEVDVLQPQHSRWKDMYEYDTPVLHVQNTSQAAVTPVDVPQSQKLFHRFNEHEIGQLINDAKANTI